MIDRNESNLSKRSGGRNNPTSKQVVASEELIPASIDWYYFIIQRIVASNREKSEC